jgi:two-component system, NtrC family, response regulator AtoC
VGPEFGSEWFLPNIPIFHYSNIPREAFMIPKRILVVDDEESFRHMLSVILIKEGYEVETSSNGEEGLQKAAASTYDQILCDIRMPHMDGLAFLREIKKTEIEATIIVMSAYGTADIAIEAMKLGAYDYISKPFKPDEIILTLRKAEEREQLRRENQLLRKEVAREYSFENIVSKNEKMQKLFDVIKKVAIYKSTVLITGESGTGKELVARALHYNSNRSQNPFMPVNCGAIPENLLESELFGHAKGAFTDAIRTKKGLFEEADGGTLFLDEIGDLPGQLQVKLLRVLQDGEIRRVGETKPIQIDVRIVAATVKDLPKEVNEGRFREDLFYRLNVLPLHIPPLRERKEDIPLLIQHFIGKYNQAMNKNVKDIDHKAMETLMSYKWYGNVRELENTIERAIVLSEKNNIEPENLPIEIQNFKEEFQLETLPEEEYSIKKASKSLELNLIKKALKKTKGNHTHAARLLEISHRALLYKIKEYEIVENE